ncbi:hypothetical protein GQ54DRAFT_300338 [Martensiomyces pterosporus]|nr:hypothetical protein GQ54DRAFT_300338 [Martensiomyces pterosporus]
MKFFAIAALFAASALAAPLPNVVVVNGSNGNAAPGTSGTIPVSRDATVVFANSGCGNTNDCLSKTYGDSAVLMASNTDGVTQAILLGFDLPVDTPSKCVLHVPPVYASQGSFNKLMVVPTDSNWDEKTVNGLNKDKGGDAVAALYIPDGDNSAKTIDISKACQQAQAGKFSIFVVATRSLVGYPSHRTSSDVDKIFSLEFSA